MDIEQVARICHETNKAYCESIGDYSQKSWEEAEEWQRQSAIAGVSFTIAGDVSPEQQHEAWMIDKRKDGWKYGPIKDSLKKEHPCMVPYNHLPIEQRVKDYLFRGIVWSFMDVEEDEKI